MKTSLSLLAAAALLSCAPLSASAQKSNNKTIPNTGVLPAACPSLDDMTAMLKMASRENIVLKLREHAKLTSDQFCEQSTKTVEGGLAKLLTAVALQDQTQICKIYPLPEVESALVTTLMVAHPYRSKPCDAFK